MAKPTQGTMTNLGFGAVSEAASDGTPAFTVEDNSHPILSGFSNGAISMGYWYYTRYNNALSGELTSFTSYGTSEASYKTLLYDNTRRIVMGTSYFQSGNMAGTTAEGWGLLRW